MPINGWYSLNILLFMSEFNFAIHKTRNNRISVRDKMFGIIGRRLSSQTYRKYLKTTPYPTTSVNPGIFNPHYSSQAKQIKLKQAISLVYYTTFYNTKRFLVSEKNLHTLIATVKPFSIIFYHQRKLQILLNLPENSTTLL